MNAKDKKLKARESSPIDNFLAFGRPKDRDQSFKEYFAMRYALRKTQAKYKTTLVEECKRRFGRQNYCFNGSRRYWVWEFETFRIFVNNTSGLGFEVIVQDSGVTDGTPGGFLGNPSKSPMKSWALFLDEICESKEERKNIKDGVGYNSRD